MRPCQVAAYEKAKSSGMEYGYSEYDYGDGPVGITMVGSTRSKLTLG